MDALLVVDMQQAYFEDGLQHDVDNIVDRINHLKDYVRQNNNKVVFIQHDGDGKETAAPHTPGWEIFSGLELKDSDLKVRKTLNDAFANSDLNSTLEQHRIQRLIICGWATDFCVDSTVRSAISQGFDVIVISDCHTLVDRPHLSADRIIEHHNWLWANLITANNTIKVIKAQEFLQAN